jgi:hypothetical protein
MQRSKIGYIFVGLTFAASIAANCQAANKSTAPQINAAPLMNEGVGMYTDTSVASQLSTFTINKNVVSCGVGTLAAGAVTGPFAMMMYSRHIDSYFVDANSREIVAEGLMRSITRVGGVNVEDVDHNFIAIAEDNISGSQERFDVHFRTDFWNTDNPMCTASTEVVGGCRFGGKLVMGEINVQ